MNYSAYIGLDVHKATIAIAEVGRNLEVRFFGEIVNGPGSVAGMLKKLGGRHRKLHFVYEAGPSGYGLHRQIVEAGHDARSFRPRTRRVRPPIVSRPIGATRSCWFVVASRRTDQSLGS